MKVYTGTIDLSTGGFPEIVDLSQRLAEVLRQSEILNGIVTVFVPGSTAGVTTIEYEPGLLKDLPALCEQLAPRDARYHHNDTWHDGNGFSHLLAALFKPSLTIPISGGQPTLGTWQQIVLLDFDNRPRTRQLVVQVMGE